MQEKIGFSRFGNRRVHGESGDRRTTEYTIWKGIIARCCNSKSEHYGDYGGRGITVCDRWRNSYKDFLDDILREIGRRPGVRHSLDRKRNDMGYEPGNVKWSTSKEQARNRRSNRLMYYMGEMKTLAELAEISNTSAHLISSRVARGWTVERAIGTPLPKTKEGRKLDHVANELRSILSDFF